MPVGSLAAGRFVLLFAAAPCTATARWWARRAGDVRHAPNILADPEGRRADRFCRASLNASEPVPLKRAEEPAMTRCVAQGSRRRKGSCVEAACARWRAPALRFPQAAA